MRDAILRKKIRGLSWGVPDVDWTQLGSPQSVPRRLWAVIAMSAARLQLWAHAWSHSRWLSRCWFYCRRVSNLHNEVQNPAAGRGSRAANFRARSSWFRANGNDLIGNRVSIRIRISIARPSSETRTRTEFYAWTEVIRCKNSACFCVLRTQLRGARLSTPIFKVGRCLRAIGDDSLSCLSAPEFKLESRNHIGDSRLYWALEYLYD